MLGRIDHVGYLALDLEASIADCQARFSMELARRIQRPQFGLTGAYLSPAGGGPASVEIFTFADRELTAERLGGARLLLDHVAHEVADIEAAAASMRRAGVRFAGPDGRGELDAAVDLDGVLHLWTVPASCDGQTLQLMQR